MKIRLPELMWYGNLDVEIELPDDWDVTFCPMRGAERPALGQEAIAQAIKNPIGCPPLHQLARGKKSACIVFDDITRPTRCAELAPVVIEELLAAGLAEDDITFVCALGSHGAHTAHEFRKKLGADILERFRVYNHNIYENCVEVGVTSRGARLLINREVAQAQVKVGLGCVTAHAQVGFSGGGKIILPGVSHIDTISHFHIDVEKSAVETTGLGNFDNNILRFEIEEAVRLAKLDFKVDVVTNGRGATIGVFAGDPIAEHLQAVAAAREIYATEPTPTDMDVVVVNAFAKANEMAIAILLGAIATGNFQGSVVCLANAPEGQVTHYLARSFGRDYGGRQYPIGFVPPGLNVVVVAPHMDKTFGDWVANPQDAHWVKSWDKALELLKKWHGPGARCAVLPNATMQYFVNQTGSAHDVSTAG
ncbi:Protein of unknown function DUF2088 [Desulfarculus baarsii DSM 2075]|uniref:LarA-like N-terminal domain-containing protein n=1 Tax=Desulfarculus baarsii (strain ATCC 33931 / DSM 2075 / LMG 7858 / VKM B-1802 / 2st14) TaxID=644282 RepID=E1QF10_DESB2|nr:lactate racemase domain-containing protein [Desulfarculus baarsii]ADK84146.1 Protein of unknown function DUF2088 [Desulfarculus baarsii DSM 2075]